MSKDDFYGTYDDEGYLVESSWDLRRKEEEKARLEQEAKLEEKRQERLRLKEEEKERRRLERVEYNRRVRNARAEKDRIFKLPEYIKNMPRTPLSDPPKKGIIPKIKTSLTGETTLSKNEKEKRILEQKRFDDSVEKYNIINSFIKDEEQSTVIISVFSPSLGNGGTTISRGLSFALAENRELDHLPIVTLDLGSPDGKIAMRYGKSNSVQASLIDIIHEIPRLKSGHATTIDSFTVTGTKVNEFFISNDSHPPSRVAYPTQENLDDIIGMIDSRYSIMIVDLDYFHKELIPSVLSVSDVVIVIASGDNPVEDVISSYQDYDDELSMTKTVAVLNAVDKSADLDDDSIENIKKYYDSAFLLPYDDKLDNEKTIKWNSLKSHSRNVYRGLASKSVELVSEFRREK